MTSPFLYSLPLLLQKPHKFNEVTRTAPFVLTFSLDNTMLSMGHEAIYLNSHILELCPPSGSTGARTLGWFSSLCQTKSILCLAQSKQLIGDALLQVASLESCFKLDQHL